MDNNHRQRKWLDLSVVVILYSCSAIYLAFDGSNPIYAVENLRIQIVLLTSLSFIMALSVILLEEPAALFICTIVDTVFVVLLIRLHHYGAGFRFWIVSSLLYRYSVSFNIPVSAIFSAILYTFFIFNANGAVFGATLEEPLSSDLLFLGISYPLVFGLFMAKGGIFRRMASIRERSVSDTKNIDLLTETNLELQKFAVVIRDESRMAERQKITRDLHDIIGYTLTSITMMLEYGGDLLRQDDKEKLSEILTSASDQARNGLFEVRKTLRQLRDMQIEKVSYFTKIKQIVDNFGAVTNINISLEYGNFTSKLNKKGEEFVYHFLQEGLTNSFRHGRASKIRIIFLQETDNMIISIEDNGVGNPDVVEGIGLNGMHERIVACGGSIRYSSGSWGFTIIARLPVSEMKDTPDDE